MGRLVIYGAGGFGREVMTAARGVLLKALADGQPREGVLGSHQIRASDEVVIAIADPQTRQRVSSQFQRFGCVIAPSAIIGEGVKIGEGAIFCDQTMVTADARIGRHFHCNIYSYVAHDCVIGDFVTFAPKVCCNGNVRIGDGAYIGTGAIIRNGTPEKPLVIGAGAIVGMGAVVTRDVAPGETVFGNPARSANRPKVAA